jgi:hypothetical protein
LRELSELVEAFGVEDAGGSGVEHLVLGDGSVRDEGGVLVVRDQRGLKVFVQRDPLVQAARRLVVGDHVAQTRLRVDTS